MPSARASSIGSALNWRFGVNGIHHAARSDRASPMRWMLAGRRPAVQRRGSRSALLPELTAAFDEFGPVVQLGGGSRVTIRRDGPDGCNDRFPGGHVLCLRFV